MNANDLCFTPATELGRMIRAKEISPVEIAETVLRRLDRLNPSLNAFLTPTHDRAMADARASEARALRGDLIGPLDGIPYSLKDLEATAGIRTTYGNKWTENFVPDFDSVVTERTRATGSVLLGKTNTPHFGYKDMCDNKLGPPCKNPWNLERTSGASSGGAGSAVGAGIGPIAHGSDGAGSIRIPSCLCGIFGLKPSFGRVPMTPSADYWAARSHSGPMTRTVRDAALLLQALAGPDARDPLSIDNTPDDYLAACDGDLKGLRVVFSADFGYAAVDPQVREIATRAARRFADFGCTYEERNPEWDDPYAFHEVLYATSMGARTEARAVERPEWIEDTLMVLINKARSVSGIDHVKAELARAAFYDQALRFFGTCDILLTPQMPVVAWSAEPGLNEGPRVIDGKPAPSLFDRLPFTYPFNLTGQPAATVPCGFNSEGLPVGLQIVGKWHMDSLVLRAAACFEEAQPWADKRPPLAVLD
jgi:Asp-tRNA(Asn)/Glu-tRNA(Gln) amidotransferase A subunit family amidase